MKLTILSMSCFFNNKVPGKLNKNLVNFIILWLKLGIVIKLAIKGTKFLY